MSNKKILAIDKKIEKFKKESRQQIARLREKETNNA